MKPPYPIIDAHVHIFPWENIRPDAASKMNQRPDMAEIYEMCQDPARLIAYMDERNIERLVMINYVAPETQGYAEEVNAYSVRMASYAPGRLIPFGGIDPRRVEDVGAEMDHLLGELGIKGIKIHPPHQLLHVNAYRDTPELKGLAAVYEKCIEYNIPVMIHTGTSVFPRARNRFGNPLDIDDVMVDFPDLKMIIAHGGRPLWMDEAFFVLRRWPENTFLDISSVPPKKLLDYFPWIERVIDQAMFGSDWPGPGVIDPAVNAADVYALPISDLAKRKLLRETAEK
ncbi:MAG: amidohydrolase, partial [Chloroflexi bacterium]|nr:amidohydrolase [Chloroflexota bacterium]